MAEGSADLSRSRRHTLCFDTAMSNNLWDAQTYDTRFGFVTAYGADQFDVLDPQPDEMILDLGCGTGHHSTQIAERGATG